MLFMFLVAFGSDEKCWLETLKHSFRNATLCSLGAPSQLITCPTGHQKYHLGGGSTCGGSSWVPAHGENRALTLESSCLRQGGIFEGKCLEST